MSYTVVREELDHEAVKFSVGFYGKVHPESRNEMSITLSSDGCMGVVVEKRYFYPGEAEAFVDAILQARQEHETKKIAAEKKWDHEHGDCMVHCGIPVDLSINQAIAVLKVAPINGDKILYAGKWLHLCRTDLKDDIRLVIDDLDRKFMQSIANYGVRISDSSFCIITSYSDG